MQFILSQVSIRFPMKSSLALRLKSQGSAISLEKDTVLHNVREIVTGK